MTNSVSEHFDPICAFAQVEIGGMLIGIPTENVVRAVPRPPSLTPIPRNHDAIDGVFREGSQVIAVVDLRKWMTSCPPGEISPPGHVMLLEVLGRTVGLAVDAVRGLIKIRRSKISQIHHNNLADSFFHSVASIDDSGGLITLLDPSLLMDQMGAWAPDVSISSEKSHGKQHAQSISMQAIVRIGQTLLAFPASAVGEILEKLEIQSLELGSRQITGTTEWRGRLTPVLSPSNSILAANGGEALMVVLVDGQSSLAFPVDQVIAVRNFSAGEIQSSVSSGMNPDLYVGTGKSDDGERILFVNASFLLEKYAITGVSGKAPLEKSSAKRAENFSAHVVYDAGQVGAVPMISLREIVNLPENYSAAMNLKEGLDGQCSWRGKLLPVVDLRPEMDRTDNGGAHLMVAHHDGRELGLLVKDVVALIPANTGERACYTPPRGTLTQIITVVSTGSRESYRILDVAAIPFLSKE